MKIVDFKIHQATSDHYNPRENYEHDSVMVYAHRNYILGDVPLAHNAQSIDEAFDIHLEDEGLTREDVVYLPTYLYDHSSITMNTTGFHCPWDAGQVGFIYRTKKELKETMGWERITNKRENQVKEWLRLEVLEFDHWITGEMYTLELIWDNGESEYVSVFLGDDWEENGLADELPTHLRSKLDDVEIEYVI